MYVYGIKGNGFGEWLIRIQGEWCVRFLGEKVCWMIYGDVCGLKECMCNGYRKGLNVLELKGIRF